MNVSKASPSCRCFPAIFFSALHFALAFVLHAYFVQLECYANFASVHDLIGWYSRLSNMHGPLFLRKIMFVYRFPLFGTRACATFTLTWLDPKDGGRKWLRAPARNTRTMNNLKGIDVYITNNINVCTYFWGYNR